MTLSFTNNSEEDYWTFAFGKDNNLAFNNCEFDNGTTFNDRSRTTFDGAVGAGSIFGEGSFSMIVSLVALIVSGISIFLIADMKKKLVPATASNTEENEDEE